jgi:hypothetical protein
MAFMQKFINKKIEASEKRIGQPVAEVNCLTDLLLYSRAKLNTVKA